jgi:proteic killer suppression protein
MIRSCRDKETEKLLSSRKFKGIERTAQKKLRILHAAGTLADLNFPSLRLEKLSGDRKGSYSIRVNDRYRICFDWRLDGAYEVEIVDYH